MSKAKQDTKQEAIDLKAIHFNLVVTYADGLQTSNKISRWELRRKFFLYWVAGGVEMIPLKHIKKISIR